MWRFGSDITVDGGAYINLKELILDRSEDAIKLFTDEELEEELEKTKSKLEEKKVSITFFYFH